MEYFIIADEDTVLGFSLVGVSGAIVETEEEAMEAWEKALENTEYGVIIVTTEVAELIRDTIDKYTFSLSFPLVVEIGVKGQKSADLKNLVNDAIGVSI